MWRGGNDYDAIASLYPTGYKSFKRVEKYAFVLIYLNEMFARRNLTPEDLGLIYSGFHDFHAIHLVRLDPSKQ